MKFLKCPCRYKQNSFASFKKKKSIGLAGRNPVKVNLRVIATTNRDLKSMVREGTFREDLYYRLNVISTSHSTALSARPDDVVVLAEHFIKVSAILNSRTATQVSPQALLKIQSWSWPGNVRELENVMERAVFYSRRPGYFA